MSRSKLSKPRYLSWMVLSASDGRGRQKTCKARTGNPNAFVSKRRRDDHPLPLSSTTVRKRRRESNNHRVFIKPTGIVANEGDSDSDDGDSGTGSSICSVTPVQTQRRRQMAMVEAVNRNKSICYEDVMLFHRKMQRRYVTGLRSSSPVLPRTEIALTSSNSEKSEESNLDACWTDGENSSGGDDSHDLHLRRTESLLGEDSEEVLQRGHSLDLPYIVKKLVDAGLRAQEVKDEINQSAPWLVWDVLLR